MEKNKEPVGKITHYFDKIGVAVVELKKGLKIGDKIKIEGEQTDFEQEIKSMQIDKKDIVVARAGTEVGLKVNSDVRKGDVIYKE